MKTTFSSAVQLFKILVGFCILISFISCEPEKTSHTSWSVYKGGADANNYSAIDQINKNNVKNLKEAWSFYPNDEPENFKLWKYECNPIIVGNVMYITSAWRWLYALEASTGKKIWSFDPLLGQRGGGVLRGVTYWTDGTEERILVSSNNQLFSVDATTGLPDSTFGELGHIELTIDEGGNRDIKVRVTTPGIIYDNLIIIGAAVSESTGAAPGHIRAYDVRSGKLAWTFHTIPWPGELGHDTWPEDGYKTAGAANNWAGMSLDEDRGIVYIPTGSPTYDYYGADRIGSNLFGNSVIALNAADGQYVWHFQTVHHDIWDYDLPTAPNLITVKQGGREIDAIAQPTKMGFVFILDRETGEPIFPVEERPVPASTVPGEEAWPTQPFPTKPASFIRQAMSVDDLIQFSPESYQQNKKVLDNLWHDGLYTPPSDQGSLLIPGSRGGAEWGGGAYDIESGVLYINANESPEIGRIKKIKKNNPEENLSLFQAGQNIYRTFCASCHGMDKKGIEANPSLEGVDKRLTSVEIIDKIQKGAGIMPAFGSILKGDEDKIIAFLSESGKNEIVVSPMTPEDTTSSYINVTAHGYFLDSLERPVITPPWGTLNAIDLNSGEYLWKIPLGNDLELHKPGEPPTGTENYGGPAVTAGGLVFIAATFDNMFRAFDKDTGDLLWETKLPGNGLANPAIYLVDGKQYVVIAVSIGKDLDNEKSGLVAFALEN